MNDLDQLEAARDGRLVRRNIHTYPFKYTYTSAAEFFEPEQGAIYIHIPFCSTKCHFCDYTIYTNTKEDFRQTYIEALKREIRDFPKNPAFPTFKIDAVYFGGGTPGLLSAEQLLDVLQTCRDTFPFVSNPEIAVEFDPACTQQDKLAQLRAGGFTRLSIGVQSFDDDILRDTNRPHDRQQIFSAIEAIKKVGFNFFNVDLIYPLLNLTLENWARSLDEAIAQEPACITAYPLEVWPKTAYHNWIVSKGRQLCSNSEEVQMASLAFDKLEAAGFVRGSASGYFHPRRTDDYCRFLTYYWRTLPMIGFGVSSKTVIHDRLYTNIKAISEYIRRISAGEHTIDFSTRLTKDQEMRRVIIRGLKVGDVSRAQFLMRFGVELDRMFGTQMKGLVSDGFLDDDGQTYSLTRKGQLFSNNVWELFYSPEDTSPPKAGEVMFGISTLILN